MDALPDRVGVRRTVEENGSNFIGHDFLELTVLLFPGGWICRSSGFFQEPVHRLVGVERNVQARIFQLRGVPEGKGVWIVPEDLAEDERLVGPGSDGKRFEISNRGCLYFRFDPDGAPHLLYQIGGVGQLRRIGRRNASRERLRFPVPAAALGALENAVAIAVCPAIPGEYLLGCLGIVGDGSDIAVEPECPGRDGGIHFDTFAGCGVLYNGLAVNGECQGLPDRWPAKGRLGGWVQEDGKDLRQPQGMQVEIELDQFAAVVLGEEEEAVNFVPPVGGNESGLVRVEGETNLLQVRPVKVVALGALEGNRGDGSVFMPRQLLEAVGTAAHRFHVEIGKGSALPRDPPPQVFRKDAGGEIFHEGRIRLAEGEAHDAFINFFHRHPLPVLAQRALVVRILDGLDGEEHVRGGYRFPVMPLRVFPQGCRVGLAVGAHLHSLGEVHSDCARPVVADELGKDQGGDVAVGAARGVERVYEARFSDRALTEYAADGRPLHGEPHHQACCQDDEDDERNAGEGNDSDSLLFGEEAREVEPLPPRELTDSPPRREALPSVRAAGATRRRRIGSVVHSP